MDTMAISKFKAHCLAVIERVRRTGTPVLITRFGEPMAEIVPPSAGDRTEHWLGCMRGTARITGDIVEPVAEQDWEALKS
jgi:prevent-host-death family protein